MFGLAMLGCSCSRSRCPTSFVGRHPMVVIPVLMWLWVNVHGTFSLGFGYLVVHLIGRWLDGAPPVRGRERDLLVGGRDRRGS